MDPRPSAAAVRYYGRELRRRLAHYVEKRHHGYRDRGSLDGAAAAILATGADRGFESGGHFRGVWPRDLAFAAPGLSAAGYADAVAETGDRLVDRLRRSSIFYTDVHEEYAAATPREGVDTFPALVILLAESDRLRAHGDAIAELAARHRERFVDGSRRGPFADDASGLVAGAGSSWWDSARKPREAYNTATLLAAIERLDARGVETTYTGRADAIRADWWSRLWNGDYVDERRDSSALACDANVVPLYFGLVDDDRAASIVDALGSLETEHGLRMRDRPFSHAAVHPFFLLHRDYHYNVWPWNSFMYAIGLQRYGYGRRARREVDRLEAVLGQYGNFLEVLTLSGEPYVKRGYASAEDFTVAAALWTEYGDRSR